MGQAQVVRLKHPGRWLAVGLVLLLLATAIQEAMTNPRFRWDVVGEYFLADQIIRGLQLTLALTAICMLVGVAVGTIVALMRLSENPVLRGGGFAFVWLFRGVPLLVQLIFWYNISALFPRINVGIPFGPTFFSFNANTVMTAYVAAILGLGLKQAAYMAEIIRSGILSVDEGQLEAAAAIGLSPGKTIRRIVFPQAMRVIIPPTGNEVISMFKSTSIVSVVAVADLLYATQLVYSRTFQIMPMLIMASIWYLILISIMSLGQSWLEHRFARGASRHQRASLWSRFARPVDAAAATAISRESTEW